MHGAGRPAVADRTNKSVDSRAERLDSRLGQHSLFYDAPIRGRSKVMDMTTGKKPASGAGKELGSSSSSKTEKSVAGSALAQAPKGGSKGGGKKK